MKCECDAKYHVSAVVILSGDIVHTQFNCLLCGSGWSEDAETDTDWE